MHSSKIIGGSLLALGFMALHACSSDPSGSLPYAPVGAQATGCIQGIVRDALTGTRVDVSAATMYAVVEGNVYSNFTVASAASGISTQQQTDLTGEYSLCGVPNVGVAVPVYLKVKNYQDMIQDVVLSGAAPNRGTNTTSQGYYDTPVVTGQNFNIFNMTTLTNNDYSVLISRHGSPVNSATVTLTPEGRGAALTGTTDATGTATFKAATIAFGAPYDISAIDPTAQGSDGTFSNAFVKAVGVNIGTVPVNAGGPKGLFSFTLDFDTAAPSGAPILVTATPNGTTSATGAVTLVFDRSIDIDKTSLTNVSFGISAFGSNSANVACTSTDIAAVVTASAQKVTDSISGRIVTITPNWATAPTLTTCNGVQLTLTLTNMLVYGHGGNVVASAVGMPTITVFLNRPST